MRLALGHAVRYTMAMRKFPVLWAVVAVHAATLAVDAAADPVALPTGRTADPAGRLTTLRAYPTGVTVSPDGSTVLAIAGPEIQGGVTPDAPDPFPNPNAGVSVFVIDAASGTTRQVVHLDDGFQDVVFARDGKRAFVAGGSHRTIYTLDVDPRSGAFAAGTTYTVRGLVSALAPAADGRTLWVAEPEAGKVERLDLASGGVTRSVTASAPNQLALTADGRTLYATSWRGSAITAIDTASGTPRALATGLHPTDVAVAPDGTVVVADANDASLATFAPGSDAAQYTDLAQLRRATDAPNAVVLGPDGRAYVSLGGDDAVAVLEPSSEAGLTAPPTAGVPLPGGKVVTAAGVLDDERGAGAAAPKTPCRKHVSHGPQRKLRCHNKPGRHHRKAAARRRRRATTHHRTATRRTTKHHAVAKHRKSAKRRKSAKHHNTAKHHKIPKHHKTPKHHRTPAHHAPAPAPAPAATAAPRGWRVAGLIPTAWYPDALALSPDGKQLHVVSARGLARSVAATQPFVDQDPESTVIDSAYGTVGTLQTVSVPHGAELASMTARTLGTLREQAPAAAQANPVLAGPDGPLRHVIYITRENKTYDSILGDLHPGTPGNALVLFGRDVTPNIHALQTQFAESDNFNYEGFASVVGHMWEDAGAVSDVFERAVGSNTGAHLSHGNESWREPTNYPATGLLTQQAHLAGLSVRTYNQELAQQSHLLPAELQAPVKLFPNFNLSISDMSREKGWEQEFEQFAGHSCTGDLAKTYGASCDLPALEYVYLGEDHTTIVDEPGYPTIQAQVADNDLATARIIDKVSHSPYWRSTVVIVVEDDPQGTGDSRSAYRGFLGIASPWIKRGTISHTPYSLTSAVGAIDRILGLPPISDFSLTSRPLDDLFTTTPDMRPFTADPSGVERYPFIALPGNGGPFSDRRHGIFSFTEPDETDPAVATAAQWRAVKHTEPPYVLGVGGVAAPPADGNG